MRITTSSVPPITNGITAVNSVYDLAFNLIKNNYTEIDNNTKRNIINKIKEVLNNGSTYTTINNKIQTDKIINKDYDGYLENTRTSSYSNLITQDKLYYHNELRVYAEPPEVEFDLNTGEIKRQEFEYFLEMKASYTLEDLYNYLKTKNTMVYALDNKKRLMGGLISLVQRHGIEKILFAIDTTNTFYSGKSKMLKNIFEIEEYMPEAEINYNMKMSDSIVNNANKIILKKRKLFKGED